jgi:hypothetical protein
VWRVTGLRSRAQNRIAARSFPAIPRTDPDFLDDLLLTEGSRFSLTR